MLSNTSKGQAWLEKAFKTCDFRECDINDYMQDPFVKSFEKPENYKEFWETYFSKDFDEIIKEKYEDSFKTHVKWRGKRMIKAVVPQPLINKLRGR